MTKLGHAYGFGGGKRGIVLESTWNRSGGLAFCTDRKRFTEGFDTRDLKEAKALLDDLRA
jgi:hypothetical protein